MRIAIISDIHGNLEAFEAVLEKIYKIRVDKIVCLGDLIDYGPNPNEVVEIAKRECDIIVMGNHDYAVVDEKIIKEFSVVARSSMLWTLSVLTEENKEFIRSLELEEFSNGIYYVHACPRYPKDWNYILEVDDAKFYMGFLDNSLTFIGHTHIPAIFKKNINKVSLINPKEEKSYKLEDNVQYLINVGSVGQPRDGDNRASFGVLDLKNSTFEIVRVDYDYNKTMNKILGSDLPQILAYRLKEGK